MNALRTSILFLMLYLIYAREITVGQFFSLWIYSFFIFGPLQELGNVINVYRETEVSLENFEEILDTPREPQPADPVVLAELAGARLRGRRLHPPDAPASRRSPTSRFERAARRDRSPSSGPRARARRRW